MPGILTALQLTPELGIHLRGLADELLVNDFAGATIEPLRTGDARDRRLRGQRLLLLHGFARRARDARSSSGTGTIERLPLLEEIKLGSFDGLDDKMQALLHIARIVRGDARELTADDVAAAHAAGATDADVQLAVLIAAGFSMYNRLVEGFRARTAPITEVYRERAGEIAAHGYSAPPVTSVPA